MTKFTEGFKKRAGSAGITDNELNVPFAPPGSDFAPANAIEFSKSKQPLTPPVNTDTQDASPTGFRKEAEEREKDEFLPPGSPDNSSGGEPTRGNWKRKEDVPPDAVPPVAVEPQNLNSFYTGFERKYAMSEKIAAKEHGMMEHKGKTIPKEVKSLADRIRKEDPGRSDEYAYRTAWDIFRSHTSEGKSYPNKSSVSGLRSEGGGSLSKKGCVMGGFLTGFEKQALSGAELGAELGGVAKSLGIRGALGGGVGALAGGENDQYGHTYNRGKGAIRGAGTMVGATLGGQLGRIHGALGLAGLIGGGVAGYQAAKHLGGKYDFEKRHDELLEQHKTAFAVGFEKEADISGPVAPTREPTTWEKFRGKTPEANSPKFVVKGDAPKAGPDTGRAAFRAQVAERRRAKSEQAVTVGGPMKTKGPYDKIKAERAARRQAEAKAAGPGPRPFEKFLDKSKGQAAKAEGGAFSKGFSKVKAALPAGGLGRKALLGGALVGAGALAHKIISGHSQQPQQSW